MRVLLITNHFYPEEFRCNDLAFELASRGHEVSVLTGIPDYPGGRYHHGYGVIRKRIETVQHVRVYHSFIIPRGRGGAFRLFLNYLSSLLAQCFDAFLLGVFGKYDCVLVHETSPVMVGVPGVIVSRMKRIPMVFWVLDLWPESLRDAGGINNPGVLALFGKLTAWIYRHSDRILISSMGFKESICEKGVFENKIAYFPNWADEAIGKDHDYELPPIPNGFRVMFAGNIGEAQDMDHLLEAAMELKEEKDIHFCLVGDGRKRQWVEDFIEEKGLHETVHWMGHHPVESMPAFFSLADIMLVTLRDSEIFNRTVPAKIQAYMNAGKPIAAMINGEGASVVKEASCGFCVPAGDAKALAELIIKMRSMGDDLLNQMGENGKAYCLEHFDFRKSVDTLERILS